MNKIMSFLEKDHVEDCSAVKNVQAKTWDTPWFLTTITLWRDKNGGKRGNGTRYFVAACNNFQCNARKYVNASDIERAIHE